MHVDHKMPRYVVIDGYDVLDNLVTLCPNDHARKTVEDRKTHGFKAWNAGKKFTKEQVDKLDISGLAIGRTWAKGRTFSEEHRRKLSEAHKGQYGHWTGKKFSAEHRQKLREAKLRKRSGANEVILNAFYK